MSDNIEVKVPNIGDFRNVAIIDVLVKPGDTISKEDSIITLESDKATIEVPSSHGGTIKDIKIKVGDKVSEGDLILTLQDGAAKAETKQAKTESPSAPTPVTPSVSGGSSGDIAKGDIHAEVLVLGAGPGGYTAAFRAADLGKKVVLVERDPSLGGVCLNVGCIPSKALLHIAKVITEASDSAHHGITFQKPQIELDKLRGWKESVVKRLTQGLSGLAKQRKVQVVHGNAEFSSQNKVSVKTEQGVSTISFDHAIIAVGSRVAQIPGFPYDDPRLIDSTGALELRDIPKRLLIIGGGIIGLEMATVYDALGSKISIVELSDGLIPGADRDLIKPLQKRIEKRYENIYLSTKVTRIEALKEGLKVHFEGNQAPAPQMFDRVLLAAGRRPNGKLIAAEKAGIQVSDAGFISVDKQQRTNVPHIFAIGDVVGEPMLAHKATHEAKVAAEVIAGHKAAFDARTIPSVAYTDPEIAWMGLTETQASKQGIEINKTSFPWAASGRALSQARDEGLTKLIFDKNTGKLLGAGMVGTNAGELIAEAVLALELGVDAQDISLTVHPHPTLSETFAFAAEIADGTITDLYVPKRA